MKHRVLLVPGIHNSGSRHWQTLWEQRDNSFVRIKFDDWHHPDRASWVTTIESTVRALGPSTVIVAHSLGCLAVAHWTALPSHAPVLAALLVSVPDPNGPNFPADAAGFGDLPMKRFEFPSVIVASQDDPYGSFDYPRRCAEAWGSRLVRVGAKGHINADSGLGEWPEGRALLDELLPQHVPH